MIRFDTPYVDTDRTLTQAGYEVLKGQERRIDASEALIAALGTGKAPLPQSGAGVGQWTMVTGASGAPSVLPAGGTWAWHVIRRTVATGAINTVNAGISAGGATIAAGVAGVDSFALCWRIA